MKKPVGPFGNRWGVSRSRRADPLTALPHLESLEQRFLLSISQPDVSIQMPTFGPNEGLRRLAVEMANQGMPAPPPLYLNLAGPTSSPNANAPQGTTSATFAPLEYRFEEQVHQTVLSGADQRIGSLMAHLQSAVNANTTDWQGYATTSTDTPPPLPTLPPSPIELPAQTLQAGVALFDRGISVDRSEIGYRYTVQSVPCLNCISTSTILANTTSRGGLLQVVENEQYKPDSFHAQPLPDRSQLELTGALTDPSQVDFYQIDMSRHGGLLHIQMMQPVDQPPISNGLSDHTASPESRGSFIGGSYSGVAGAQSLNGTYIRPTDAPPQKASDAFPQNAFYAPPQNPTSPSATRFFVNIFDANHQVLERLPIQYGVNDINLNLQPINGTTSSPTNSSIYFGIENVSPLTASGTTPYQLLISRSPSASDNPPSLTSWNSNQSITTDTLMPAGSISTAPTTESTDLTNSESSSDGNEASSATSESTLPTNALVTTELPVRAAAAFGGVLNKGDAPSSTSQQVSPHAVDLVLSTEFAPQTQHADNALPHDLGGVPLQLAPNQAIQLDFDRLRPSESLSSGSSNPVGPTNSSETSSTSSSSVSKGKVGLQMGLAMLPVVVYSRLGKPEAKTKVRKSLLNRFKKLGDV